MDAIRALQVDSRDNVAMLLAAGEPGATVSVGEERLTLQDPVPYGHKVAVRLIQAGEVVLKYGVAIGVAACDIAPGQHVHVHNVVGHRPGLRGQEGEK